LSTAAVPESTYCSPQPMRKIGSPAFTNPITARCPSAPGSLGSRCPMKGRKASMATAPSPIRYAVSVAGGSSSTAILIHRNEDPQITPSNMKTAGTSQPGVDR
jgi:hypothetical protein